MKGHHEYIPILFQSKTRMLVIKVEYNIFTPLILKFSAVKMCIMWCLKMDISSLRHAGSGQELSHPTMPNIHLTIHLYATARRSGAPGAAAPAAQVV